jgi:hypothetical protein
MLLDNLTPAEQEAWNEVRDAELALELAQLRFWTVTDQQRRPARGHLRIIDGGRPTTPPADAVSIRWK